MALTERQARLLEQDRWAPLRQFAAQWYSQPIGEDDGNTPEEIEESTKRIGVPMPTALAEWFLLVGKRLRDVQDSPRRLHQLKIEGGRIAVWVENQGVWSILAPVDGDDPECRVDDEESFVFPAVPLSKTLLGMLVSDTIVGAWAGSRVGPLGRLAPSVRGGYCEDFSDDRVERLRQVYERLRIPGNPFFGEPCLGAPATIIRSQPTAVEWMTATDEAFRTLDGLLSLDPPGSDREVVFAFESLNDRQFRALTVRGGAPDTDTYRSLLGPEGHLGRASASRTGGRVLMHVTTKDPDQVVTLLLPAFPDDLKARLTIAVRPASISVYRVLFPPGKDSFALPE